MVFALGVSSYSVHIIPFISKRILNQAKANNRKCKYYYSNIRIGVFVKYDTKAEYASSKI